MKKLKLLLAGFALLGGVNSVYAQTADQYFPSVFFPTVSDDISASATDVADLNDFSALSGNYTIEVEGTKDTEITFPYDRYRTASYTPTVSGTIRFVSTSTTEKVFVYEKATAAEVYTYKGKATISSITWPSMTTDDVNDATNLLGNPDFQTVGDAIKAEDNKYKLGSPWAISNDGLYGASKIRQGKNSNSHDSGTGTTDCFVWRIDGSDYNNAYFYQEVTLKPNGKYKYRTRISQNTNSDGTYSVRLGSTAGGDEYSKVSFTVGNNTTKQVKDGDLTTPATLGEHSYFSVKNGTYNSSNHKACSQIDLFQLVEATNVATEITGVTSAKYVAGTAISPIFVGNATAAIKNPFIESGTSNWTGGATGTGNQYTGAPGGTYLNIWNGTANMYQDIASLPQGQYTIKVATRASTETPVAYIYAAVSGKKIGVTSIGRNGDMDEGTLGKGWKWINVDFYNPSEGTVRIGFYADCSSSNWAGADEFYLTYKGDVAPTTTTIAETATSAPTAYAKANVTLTRTLKADIWNTFSLPFNLSVDEIHASALSGATIKKFSSVDENVINFEDATEIEAGEPYLVNFTGDDIVDPKFYNVAVGNISGNTKGDGDYKFAAQIYDKALSTDGTIAYLATDGSIKRLTSGGIKGMRAYFIVPAEGALARVSFGDDETGISEVKEQMQETRGGFYDLQGRKVKIMKKGIYVVNGKKVVKK